VPAGEAAGSVSPRAADAAWAAALQVTFRETSQTNAIRGKENRSDVNAVRCRQSPTQLASAMAASGSEKVAPRTCQRLTTKAAVRNAISIHPAALLRRRSRSPSTISAVIQ